LGNETERLRIDSSGNVGIGTSSPVGRFASVGGAIQLSGGTTAQEGIRIQRVSGYAGIYGINNDNNAYNAIALFTSASEAMRIDTSGNVGIGTSSPAGKVSTERAAASAGWAYHVKTTGISNDSGIYMTASNNFEMVLRDSSTNLSFITNNGNNLAFNINGTERLRLDSSGRLGIGTSAPDYLLTLQTADAAISMKDSGGTTRAYIGIAGAFGSAPTGALRLRSDQGGLVYGFAGTEQLRIDSSGRVGIGTSSPDGSFIATFSSGVGAIRLDTSGTSDGLFMNCNSGGTAGQSVYVLPVRTAGSLRGGIQWNGTNLLYNTSSDYRLKTDVAPMQGALARISSLKPCTYIWIEQQLYGEGFIAHELAEHIPGAVNGEKDAVNDDGSIKSQSVDYSKIVVHLVAAIQELSAKVAALEAAHP
jgi:hypothetical protein